MREPEWFPSREPRWAPPPASPPPVVFVTMPDPELERVRREITALRRRLARLEARLRALLSRAARR